ncbi:hypothetical protein HY387_00310 [Candidatus Daviesbacteria bacterium]|nr:hypothetical protein [Candidatus Daviesbacteria bacterium]
MNKKILTFIIIITFIIFITIIFRNQQRVEKNLISPGVSTSKPTSTPSPSPQTFKFDSTTDLQKELDSVDPQVLDSDFEVLDKVL